MSNQTNIKLGIACVYFFRDEDAWLLDMQLDFIEKTTGGIDYTVYAAANRLQDHLKTRLEARSFVKIVDLPPFEGYGGPEHGYFLTQLAKHAKVEGCTHVCTLDCDSFPAAPGWASKLLDQMDAKYKVASVFRAENNDSDLPHPCGTFFECTLLDQIDFDFWPGDALRDSQDFKTYIAETNQRIDTGTGLGFALWKAKIPWLKLLRSNKTNLHFMMAGLYEDVFFHLGASSRSPAFHLDYMTRPYLKLSLKLRSIPLLWRIGYWIEKRYLAENQSLANQIREHLQRDPDGFISSLKMD